MSMIDFSSVKSIRLPQGKAKSLQVNGRVLWRQNTQHDILPPGYTRLEYIESTGKQYLSIPVTVRGSDGKVFEVETDVQFMDSSARMLMGFSTSVGAYWGVGANLSYYELGGSSYSIKLDPSVRRTVHFLRVDGDATLRVGEEEVARVGAAGLSGLPWSVFAVGSASNYCKAKLFGLKITEDSVLTYDLIPCRDAAGKPALFDTVTRQTFYNQGSGDFSYPSE